MSASLVLMMGRILPEESLIEKLKESISDYEINPSEENKRHIAMWCMMFATKQSIDKKTDEEFADTLKEIETTQRIKERLTSEKS